MTISSSNVTPASRCRASRNAVLDLACLLQLGGNGIDGDVESQALSSAVSGLGQGAQGLHASLVGVPALRSDLLGTRARKRGEDPHAVCGEELDETLRLGFEEGSEVRAQLDVEVPPRRARLMRNGRSGWSSGAPPVMSTSAGRISRAIAMTRSMSSCDIISLREGELDWWQWEHAMLQRSPMLTMSVSMRSACAAEGSTSCTARAKSFTCAPEVGVYGESVLSGL